jgi:hypothetical protein
MSDALSHNCKHCLQNVTPSNCEKPIESSKRHSNLGPITELVSLFTRHPVMSERMRGAFARIASALPTSRYSYHLEGLRVQEPQYPLANVGAEAGRHRVAFIGV